MRAFIRTNSEHTEFQNLVKLLDADLAVRDGDEHAFYAQFNFITNIPHVILAKHDQNIQACGAFKPFDNTSVEIKRMFTLPEYRGQGIGLLVLKELETWAKELGYTRCVLETGKKQPEAIRLYEKAGYSVIENYGQYIGVENSVCFEKCLSF